jgi:alpha-aminoadipate/glutamate carrier protein LysW
MATTAPCPACGSNVGIDDSSDIGDMMECESCGAQLELTSLKPPRLEATSADDAF